MNHRASGPQPALHVETPALNDEPCNPPAGTRIQSCETQVTTPGTPEERRS
jgi:hypothetical protein